MYQANRMRVTSLFNLEVMASFIMLIGIFYDFYIHIARQFEILQGTGIAKYAWFMAAMTIISFLILFIHGVINARGGMFIWMPVAYVMVAFLSTILGGLYPPDKLPFRFVEMFYWVAIMLLSYYAVLNLGTTKFHVAVVLLLLPLLAYIFLKTRNAEAFYTDMLAVNPVYFLAYLMPVVMLVKSKLLKWGYLFLLFVLIILSYKRLAILAYVTSLLVYFYFLSTKSSSNAGLWKSVMIGLGAAMFVAVLAFAFQRLSGMFQLEWSERMSTMVESGGSGRLTIYQEVFRSFMADPSYWLMGRGHNGVFLTLGIWAHNDLLEILYDFGIIGVTLYLLFILRLVQILFEMKRFGYNHTGAYAASLVWFAWGTMFSILVPFPMWFLGLPIFWGITVADFENMKRQAYCGLLEESVYTDECRGGTPSECCA